MAHADKLMQTWREYLLNEDRAAKLQREVGMLKPEALGKPMPLNYVVQSSGALKC